MSEMRPKPAGESRWQVTEDEATDSPQLWRQYQDERITSIKAGEPVWLLRNSDGASDMDPGVVIDFYAAGKHQGYIEGDDLAGYQVYGPPVPQEHEQNSEGEQSVHLNMEPVMPRSEAEKML